MLLAFCFSTMQISRVACDESFTKFWEKGTYICAQCAHPLYHSSAKFDGPCAWPSFRTELNEQSLFLNPVAEYNNYKCAVIELYCSQCKLFMGYVPHFPSQLVALFGPVSCNSLTP
jgi:peptide-methionine (R)-S-oxide reductase